MDVNLVVSGAVMSAEDETLRQDVDELLIPDTRHFDAEKSPECDDHTVELARFAFLDEVGAVLGFGFDELRDVREGVPDILYTRVIVSWYLLGSWLAGCIG